MQKIINRKATESSGGRDEMINKKKWIDCAISNLPTLSFYFWLHRRKHFFFFILRFEIRIFMFVELRLNEINIKIVKCLVKKKKKNENCIQVNRFIIHIDCAQCIVHSHWTMHWNVDLIINLLPDGGKHRNLLK